MSISNMILRLRRFSKDEAADLEEWLQFHSGVGVDHFILYDNGSSDNFREVLAPWLGAGRVTLVDWASRTPMRGVQSQHPRLQRAMPLDCLYRFG